MRAVILKCKRKGGTQTSNDNGTQKQRAPEQKNIGTGEQESRRAGEQGNKGTR